MVYDFGHLLAESRPHVVIGHIFTECASQARAPWSFPMKSSPIVVLNICDSNLCQHTVCQLCEVNLNVPVMQTWYLCKKKSCQGWKHHKSVDRSWDYIRLVTSYDIKLWHQAMKCRRLFYLLATNGTFGWVTQCQKGFKQPHIQYLFNQCPFFLFNYDNCERAITLALGVYMLQV